MQLLRVQMSLVHRIDSSRFDLESITSYSYVHTLNNRCDIERNANAHDFINFIIWIKLFFSVLLSSQFHSILNSKTAKYNFLNINYYFFFFLSSLACVVMFHEFIFSSIGRTRSSARRRRLECGDYNTQISEKTERDHKRVEEKKKIK